MGKNLPLSLQRLGREWQVGRYRWVYYNRKVLRSSYRPERCERFRAYADVERYKRIEVARNNHDDFHEADFGPPGEIERVTSARAQFKERYSGSDKQWHGKASTLELAKDPDVNMLTDYTLAYRAFCLHTHPSFLGVKEYRPDDGRAQSSWLPTVRLASEVAALATGYILGVVETHKTVLGIIDDDLHNVIQEIKLNLLGNATVAGHAEGKMSVSIEGDGSWGILPSFMQKGL